MSSFVRELARVGLGIVSILVDFLKWSKFMVIRTFSKILTHSVLFEVHRLCFAVVSQAQCSVIELRGTLVRGVGNTVLVAGFKYLFYTFSV